MNVDAIIVAIGQSLVVPEENECTLTEAGCLAVDPQTMTTNLAGVFAAGDSVKGIGTVIEAIADGHRAAAAIFAYLNETKIAGPEAQKPVMELDPKKVPNFFKKNERWSMPVLAASDAVRGFEEVNLGLTDFGAVQEARRCLNCRYCLNCMFERGKLCQETTVRLISERKEL